MKSKPKSLGNDLSNALRGVCMGCADVVPGVSGGTVALVLGIYERLISAISHFDLTLLAHLRRREWKNAAAHVDLRFLVSLALGIGAGIVGMALLISILMSNAQSRQLTLAAFFGMIVASGVLVARLIKVEHRWQAVACVVLGLWAAAFAFWLTTLPGAKLGAPAYWYLFLCGCVAICAMILPGISGAMISLVLGVYLYLTQIPRDLLSGENVGSGLISLAVFGCGCAVGLLSFSKILKLLLTRYHAMTMAVLCGFMFGALRKLWPFQEPIAGELKHFEPFMPTAINGAVIAVCGVALAAMASVFIVDRMSRMKSAPAPSKPHNKLSGQEAIGS